MKLEHLKKIWCIDSDFQLIVWCNKVVLQQCKENFQHFNCLNSYFYLVFILME
jgi:hypothetical protein